ncbi:hypothetical protein FRX31_016429 [Thalictrum thalictroides]|uniref:Uncharacterized protein n=1 Tax=Thalictrum thalictroides TaxID=46969 RepID=A0A7J6WC74_THATH|nr:hypothetical protein FRX31_016429 [Thalictrum thalictroides]
MVGRDEDKPITMNATATLQIRGVHGSNQEAIGEGNWELPKKRHTCRARGDNLGSPKGGQVVDNNKGEEVSMGSLDRQRTLARNKALHEKKIPGSYRESPNRVDMGQDPGPPV